MANAIIARPQRWDAPFGPEMADDDVNRLLKLPEFSNIDSDSFPKHTPLDGIIRNDSRIVKYQPGDIIVREGDYGNSAFLVISGNLRVVIAPSLPRNLIGRQASKKKNFFEALSQLWTNHTMPEVRDTSRYGSQALREGNIRGESDARVFLQDIPSVLDKHNTAQLGPSSLFGELAALGRVPRTASIFSEDEAELLEIRWQGLRELRKYDPDWRKTIDERYRENALKVHLKSSPYFKGLSQEELNEVADATLFESHGSFEWHVSYKRETNPLVSLIVPTKDRLDLLVPCIESILTKTDYPNFELVIVDNNSELDETHEYLNSIKDSRIQVMIDRKPFNHSRIMNRS